MQNENGQKKYLQIAEQIRKEIISGVYKEGQMIPTIRELAKLYGVNPQTVNKATAHLASLGYVRSRQGAGSEVVLPEQQARGGVYMLIDEHRSRYLEDLDDPRNYHGKDIYLTYLMRMSKEGRRSKFLVYDREDTVPRPEVVDAIGEVAGLLVQGSLPPVYLELLGDKNVPVVLINRKTPAGLSNGRVASVIIGLDRLHSLVDYAVTLGHRSILFVRASEFEKNEAYEERLAVVRQAVAGWSHQFEISIEEFTVDANDPACVAEFKDKATSGYTCALGYNDGSALQTYALVQRAGFTVGSDISVCGFDDITAARLATPPLTTVRVDRSRLVREAFSLLDELSQSPGPLFLNRVLETELMIRKSALPPSRAC